MLFPVVNDYWNETKLFSNIGACISDFLTFIMLAYKYVEYIYVVKYIYINIYVEIYCVVHNGVYRFNIYKTIEVIKIL